MGYERASVVNHDVMSNNDGQGTRIKTQLMGAIDMDIQAGRSLFCRLVVPCPLYKEDDVLRLSIC